MNNQSLTTIDDLPFEVFELIVDQLKLKDKLKLPLVSKLWYTKFIHLKKITKLYISEESKNWIPNRFHLNRAEFNQHFFRINSNKFNRFFNLFKSTELSNLKDLRIFILNKCSTDFISILNSIKSLENLLICITGLQGSIEISLPNLKSFTTDYLSIKELSFNTPKLKCFEIDAYHYCYFPIHFEHPNSLEFIQTNWYDISCVKFLDFQKFPNLKKLIIKSLANVGDNFLSNFNQLEEMHINKMGNVFMRIYNQKLKLNLFNLKIYNYGLLIENSDNYNEWFRNRDLSSKTLTNALASLHLANYSKLSNEFILQNIIDYSSFEHLNLKAEFRSKFTNLRIFSINKPIKYEERFLQLSKSKLTANIEYFRICINSKSSNLLDKLNLVIPFLQKINISVEEPNLPVNNFKFLFKLKYLTRIEVESELDYNFIIELYQNLKYLISLYFKILSGPIFIRKLNNSFYLSGLNSPNFNSINNLLEHLKNRNLI